VKRLPRNEQEPYTVLACLNLDLVAAFEQDEGADFRLGGRVGIQPGR
jgi:hypothetical protein